MAAIGLALAGCSAGASPAGSPAVGGPSGSSAPVGSGAAVGSGGPASVEAAPVIGANAPSVALSDLDGRPLSLADLRGKPVVVNFWASWCGPCRDEFPLLKDALAAHASAGLVVVGILFKDDVAPARDFMAKQGATWTSLADPDGAAATAYRVIAPPTTFFVDRGGVVRDLQLGGMTKDQLDRHLGTILR